MPKRADKVAAAPTATNPQGSTDDPPWLVPESELRGSLIETSGDPDIPDEQEIAEGFDGPIGDGSQGREVPSGEGTPTSPVAYVRWDDGDWGNSGDGDAGADNGPGGRVGIDSSGVKWVAPHSTSDAEMLARGVTPAQKAEEARKPAARKPRASRAKPASTDAQDAATGAQERASMLAALVPGSPETPAGEIELVPLDDTTEYLSVVYYGVEGTGKTTDSLLMSTLSEPGIVVAVNAEGGMKKGALTAMGVDTSRVMAYPRPGERITFEGLERLFFQLSARLAADPGSVLGVVWDSVTDIVQEILDQRVESVVQTQQEIVARNKGARPGNIRLRDRFDNDRDDYRYMSNQVRSLLRKYRYLPCHFVVTALMRRDEDEMTKRVMYGPAVTPALQTDLLGYVDLVLNCQVAEIGDVSVYFATTVPTRTTRGKDRLHVLPTPELVNPSFDRLIAYTRGGLSADTDPEQKLLAAKPAPAQSGTAAKPARAASGKRAAKPSAPTPPPPVTGNPDDQPPY